MNFRHKSMIKRGALHGCGKLVKIATNLPRVLKNIMLASCARRNGRSATEIENGGDVFKYKHIQMNHFNGSCAASYNLSRTPNYLETPCFCCFCLCSAFFRVLSVPLWVCSAVISVRFNSNIFLSLISHGTTLSHVCASRRRVTNYWAYYAYGIA